MHIRKGEKLVCNYLRLDPIYKLYILYKEQFIQFQ